MELVLALDAGTSGVRTVAFDATGHRPRPAYRELTQHFPDRVRSSTTPSRSRIWPSRPCAKSPCRPRARRHHRRARHHQPTRDHGRLRPCDEPRRERHCLAGPTDVALLRRTRRAGQGPPRSRHDGTRVRLVLLGDQDALVLEHGALDGLDAPSLATIDTWLPGG